jgi:acetolactate synthase-1/2/3 large subunit
MADSIPVVLICGQVPRAVIGSDAFQEAPVFNVMTPCAKHVFLVEEPEELEETVRTAFEIARSGRPGPVVIDLPKDVQNWEGVFKGEGVLPIPGFRNRLKTLMASRVSEEKCAAFYELLKKSNKPLIYAGGGVIHSNAAAELSAFAHSLQIPVTTTLLGIGAVDTTSPLSLRMLGMHGTAYANYAVEDCDMLIAVGARFDDRVAGKVHEFAPNARSIAHIDIDAAEIGKVKAVTWGHVGDAKSALTDLLAGRKGFKKDFSRWVHHVEELRRRYALNYDRESDRIQPHFVIESLNELTRGEAIVTTGVGQHQMWAAQYFDFKHPRSFLTSGSMGTMGFGLPAAIGSQFAAPGRLVIDVDGDGSLRMNIGELETLTTYDIPVKVLLLNNLGDGMVRQWQSLFYQNRYCGTDKSLHKKDFVKAAEADGIPWARRVTAIADVHSALEQFVRFDGPALLEVFVDQNAHVYPMVGPGLGYKDMLTGKWIKARDGRELPDTYDPDKSGGYF